MSSKIMESMSFPAAALIRYLELVCVLSAGLSYCVCDVGEWGVEELCPSKSALKEQGGGRYYYKNGRNFHHFPWKECPILSDMKDKSLTRWSYCCYLCIVLWNVLSSRPLVLICVPVLPPLSHCVVCHGSEAKNLFAVWICFCLFFDTAIY